jgi:4-amino-4-deoxy-L-arabinose transferase-like glycosyltransferase
MWRQLGEATSRAGLPCRQPKPAFKRPAHVWRAEYAWLLAILPLLVYLGLDALVPPMGDIGSDGVAYHLVGPSQWLRLHHIVALHGNFPTTYPALVETLFGAVMAIGNVRAAQLVAFLFGLLLLHQVWELVRELGGDRHAAALATALVACTPVVMPFATVAFVDLAFAAFAIAAARMAWRAVRPRDWLLAGALLGFAIGTKYTGILLLLAAGLALVFTRRARPAGAFRWAHLAIWLGTALAAGCAWYIRNAIVFLAPIYPLPLVGGNHWPGRYITVAGVHQFEQYMRVRGAGMGRSLTALLLFPFNYTFDTYRFHGGGGLGIVPLAFGPVALWRWIRQPWARYWALWCLFLGGLWFYTMQDSRYLIPVVVVWIGFAALEDRRALGSAAAALRGAAALAIVVSMAYGAGGMAWDNGHRPARVASLFSAERAAALWQELVPGAAAFAFLNRESGGGRVLLLDPRTMVYYLHRPYLLLRGPYEEQPLGPVTQEQALAELPQLGVTEILDMRSPVSDFRLHPQEKAAWRGREQSGPTSGSDPAKSGEPQGVAGAVVTPVFDSGQPRLRLEFSSPDARVYRVLPSAWTPPGG